MSKLTVRTAAVAKRNRNDLPRGAAVEDEEITRFLAAWFGLRQLIQAANFNHFHQAGLSATQFMTLNLIPEREENITIGELAKRLNLKPSTVAKTVDSLETRGMLKRTRSSLDGRLVLVSITDSGKTLQNSAVGQFRSFIVKAFRAIPPKKRIELITGLESLVDAAAGAAKTSATAIREEGGVGPQKRNSPQSRQRRSRSSSSAE